MKSGSIISKIQHGSDKTDPNRVELTGKLDLFRGPMRRIVGLLFGVFFTLTFVSFWSAVAVWLFLPAYAGVIDKTFLGFGALLLSCLIVDLVLARSP